MDQSHLELERPPALPLADLMLRPTLVSIREVVMPHLQRAGGPILLALALDLTLAGGGPCSLSYSDLTVRLGCSRAAIAQARRLGEALGLIACAPGPRIADRSGPAPLAWSLCVPRPARGAPSESSASPPISPDQSTSVTSRVDEPVSSLPYALGERCLAGADPDLAAHRAGYPRQPVSRDPDQGPDSYPDDHRDESGSLPDRLKCLVNAAAARVGEGQPACAEHQLVPFVEQLARDGWSLEAIQVLLDEAVEATAVYRPAHPTSYLITVLRQRVSWRQPETAPPVPRTKPLRQHPALLPMPARQPVPPAPQAAGEPPMDQEIASASVRMWQPSATIAGLPCHPEAALRAALDAARLSREPTLVGAHLVGWERGDSGAGRTLLIATRTMAPMAVARRLAPLLRQGLTAIVGYPVGCRLVAIGELNPVAVDVAAAVGPDTDTHHRSWEAAG